MYFYLKNKQHKNVLIEKKSFSSISQPLDITNNNFSWHILPFSSYTKMATKKILKIFVPFHLNYS
jgi:hypothetical protein